MSIYESKLCNTVENGLLADLFIFFPIFFLIQSLFSSGPSKGFDHQ